MVMCEYLAVGGVVTWRRELDHFEVSPMEGTLSERDSGLGPFSFFLL